MTLDRYHLDKRLLIEAETKTISATDAVNLLLAAHSILDYSSVVSAAICGQIDMQTVAYPDTVVSEVLYGEREFTPKNFQEAAHVFAKGISTIEDLFLEDTD